MIPRCLFSFRIRKSKAPFFCQLNIKKYQEISGYSIRTVQFVFHIKINCVLQLQNFVRTKKKCYEQDSEQSTGRSASERTPVLRHRRRLPSNRASKSKTATISQNESRTPKSLSLSISLPRKLCKHTLILFCFSSFIIQVSDPNVQLIFSRIISRVFIVQLSCRWCNPCRLLTPRIEQVVAEKQGKILLAKVDIDEHTDLALDYEVSNKFPE